MSLIARAMGLETRSAPPKPDGTGSLGIPQSSGYWAEGMIWNGGDSATVTDDQAMKVSAVYACIRLLTDAISTLPLDTFTRTQGARKPYRPRPTYLDFKPPQQRRINLFTEVVASLTTDGNAFLATPRNSLGVPVDLYALDPGLVSVARKNGKLVYTVRGTEGEFSEWDILHIPGLTLPGQLRGLSPLAYAKETVSVGRSAQRFGAKFFDNGAMPSAVLETDRKMSKEAAEVWRDSWNAGHSGDNQQRVGVLTEGAKLNKVSIAPDDAQFLETRQFSVSDIARFYGVPPHLIADSSNSTSWGSGLSEQNLAFGQFALRPITERIESGLDWLLTTHGLSDVFVKLNMDALLRASLKDRYESYRTAIEAGFMAPNEARRLEDLPPLPGGDVLQPKATAATGTPDPPSEVTP